MNKYLKGILIFLGIVFLLFVILIIVILYAFMQDPFGFDKLEYSSKKELVENYELKQKEITELYNHTKSITENGKIYVYVEFKDDNKIKIFRVESDSAEIAKTKRSSSVVVPPSHYVKTYFDITITSKEVDTMLNRLEWTRKTLQVLKTKLDEANCISIESGEPMTIGFKRNGMGMYFYNIFEKSLSDSLMNKYNDGCRYIFYKDNIVLEYGGGAIGMQCFETYGDKEHDNSTE